VLGIIPQYEIERTVNKASVITDVFRRDIFSERRRPIKTRSGRIDKKTGNVIIVAVIRCFYYNISTQVALPLASTYALSMK